MTKMPTKASAQPPDPRSAAKSPAQPKAKSKRSWLHSNRSDAKKDLSAWLTKEPAVEDDHRPRTRGKTIQQGVVPALSVSSSEEETVRPVSASTDPFVDSPLKLTPAPPHGTPVQRPRSFDESVHAIRHGDLNTEKAPQQESAESAVTREDNSRITFDDWMASVRGARASGQPNDEAEVQKRLKTIATMAKRVVLPGNAEQRLSSKDEIGLNQAAVSSKKEALNMMSKRDIRKYVKKLLEEGSDYTGEEAGVTVASVLPGYRGRGTRTPTVHTSRRSVSRIRATNPRRRSVVVAQARREANKQLSAKASLQTISAHASNISGVDPQGLHSALAQAQVAENGHVRERHRRHWASISYAPAASSPGQMARSWARRVSEENESEPSTPTPKGKEERAELKDTDIEAVVLDPESRSDNVSIKSTDAEAATSSVDGQPAEQTQPDAASGAAADAAAAARRAVDVDFEDILYRSGFIRANVAMPRSEAPSSPAGMQQPLSLHRAVTPPVNAYPGPVPTITVKAPSPPEPTVPTIPTTTHLGILQHLQSTHHQTLRNQRTQHISAQRRLVEEQDLLREAHVREIEFLRMHNDELNLNRRDLEGRVDTLLRELDRLRDGIRGLGQGIDESLLVLLGEAE
ncbi:MAG: hypothetical protein M1828_002972 [Chrysothrix sp. TS-e1954]|nr:MAG: hypothetical protein M1828_002972 [Chrysothrix sp. TS-e1954]